MLTWSRVFVKSANVRHFLLQLNKNAAVFIQIPTRWPVSSGGAAGRHGGGPKHSRNGLRGGGVKDRFSLGLRGYICVGHSQFQIWFC